MFHRSLRTATGIDREILEDGDSYWSFAVPFEMESETKGIKNYAAISNRITIRSSLSRLKNCLVSNLVSMACVVFSDTDGCFRLLWSLRRAH